MEIHSEWLYVFMLYVFMLYVFIAIITVKVKDISDDLRRLYHMLYHYIKLREEDESEDVKK